MSCTCQDCGKLYKVDFIVPDCIWDKIRPANKKKSGGLLCGVCIAKAIESIGDYDYWYLLK